MCGVLGGVGRKPENWVNWVQCLVSVEFKRVEIIQGTSRGWTEFLNHVILMIFN